MLERITSYQINMSDKLIYPPNSGLRINSNKLRIAYGSQFEYSEAAGVGISKTSHIFFNDNQFEKSSTTILIRFYDYCS